MVLTNSVGDLVTLHPEGLVKIKFLDIDPQMVLYIDVQPDCSNRYESPSTKKEDQGKNLKRRHVRIHGAGKSLDVGDAVNWGGS